MMRYLVVLLALVAGCAPTLTESQKRDIEDRKAMRIFTATEYPGIPGTPTVDPSTVPLGKP